MIWLVTRGYGYYNAIIIRGYGKGWLANMNATFMRKRIKDDIQNNPFSLVGNLYLLKDNGYGSNVEDTNKPSVEKSYTNDVRIFRKKRGVKTTNANKTPYTYEEIYYMLSDYETVVDTKLIFIYNDIRFRVKTREPIIKYGSIIGYQYELDETTEVQIA